LVQGFAFLDARFGALRIYTAMNQRFTPHFLFWHAIC